jgi:hypothetical protein
MNCATSGVGTTYPSGVLEIVPVLSGDRCFDIFTNYIFHYCWIRVAMFFTFPCFNAYTIFDSSLFQFVLFGLIF